MPDYPKRFRLPSGPAAHRDYSRAVACLREPARAGEPAITEETTQRLKEAGIVLEDEPANHGSSLMWFRTRKRRAKLDAKVLERVLKPKLAWVGPVYRLRGQVAPHGLFCPRPDTLLLRASPDSTDRLESEVGRLRAEEDPHKSAYLAGWRYLRLPSPRRQNAIDVLASWRNRAPDIGVDLEYVPFVTPSTAIPSDPLFAQQWNMVRIGAPEAWDLSTGDRAIVVAVIDSGCDLVHPDLMHAYVSPGFNSGDATLDGSPIVLAPSGALKWHGTAVAGVIGAAFDNGIGMAGIAGDCGILPVALPDGSTVETAVGVRRAAMEGASILNLSWAIGSAWFDSHTRGAIDDALAAGCVVCAASGNLDGTVLALPAGYPPVMACGGSDEEDIRWRDPRTGLGSHYGDAERYGAPTGVSVVAPAVNVTATDISGPDGFFTAPSPGGDYIVGSGTIPAYFGMTSAATPHVAAVAALIKSAYPGLSAGQVRRLIERTAEKVGGYGYVDVPGYAHGSRHPEMGYGRLNAGRALTLGDVMIRDWRGDDGREPSTPPGGNFFSYSDLVVRPEDDGVFEPGNPDISSNIVPGRDHTVVVRVRNTGPATARNVNCEVRATPWVGVHFLYPQDWTLEDPLHVRAASMDAVIPALAVGAEEFLRFSLSAAQIDELAGWSDMRWHPCMLAVAMADNDHAFADAPGGSALQMRRNNLAQRNLTVATVGDERSMEFPFVIGHPDDKVVRFEIIVEAGPAATEGEVYLVLDDDGRSFPVLRQHQAFEPGDTRVERIKGGESVSFEGRRAVRMLRQKMSVLLKAPRPGRRPLSLYFRLPATAERGATFPLTVFERLPDGRFAGGAGVVVRVADD